jgi:MFS family permease
MTTAESERTHPGTTAAFAVPFYRKAWAASMAANLGLFIQSVGSAWAMTQMAASPAMVALVQTSLMIPIMFLAMPAGAIADMYDRRIVALIAVLITLCGATGLAVTSLLHVLTPDILLACCFVIGSGMALQGPAWQSSISEQVPPSVLPSAIALGSISFSLARSFGPAIGGGIVASIGPAGAFVTSAIFYLPAVFVMATWRRPLPTMRLPPEGLGRAIISGARYVIHSPPTRTMMIRALLTATASGAVGGLMPLISRDLLHGNAQTFGICLGAYGMGAVCGALGLGRLRSRMQPETMLRICAVSVGLCIIVVSQSHILPLTLVALFIAGGLATITFSLFNIELQVSLPRWVVGRSLAVFQAAASGGTGLGAGIWGLVAKDHGLSFALVGSGLAMIACASLGVLLGVSPPADAALAAESETPADPEVRMALTPRSGPIVVEMEYRIALDQARAFYQAMQEIQLMRQRNGAYDWSLARDVADPGLWTERFHCSTWLGYLHLRARSTQADRAIQAATWNMHTGPEPVRIRRMLERPYGSVRWKDETPDSGAVQPLPLSAFPGSSA